MDEAGAERDVIRLRNCINRSLSRRLLFFFIPFIVVLLIATTLLSFISFFNTLKQEKETSTLTLVSQIRDNFDYYFHDIKTMMAYLSINVDIQHALTQYEKLSFQEQYFLNNRISDSIGSVNIFKSFINDIIIIGNNGYQRNLPNYYSLNQYIDLSDSEWLRNYQPGENSNFRFTPPHQADYYEGTVPVKWVVSAILPLTVEGRTLGFLQGDIDYEKLRTLLDTVYKQNEIEITIVTSDGAIVFDRDINNVNLQLDHEIFSQLDGNAGTFVTSGQDDNNMIVYLQSDVTGWYLIASIPYSALLGPAYTVSRTILFVILPLSLLIAIAIFLLIARQIRQPWSKLVHRVETVTVANYQPAQIDYGVGEIAELGEKFESMLAQNNQLIEQVYVAEIKKKNAELIALREQITPHFVYNSLQVVKAEAIFAKNKQISQTVTAIADLLRYAMDNHNAQVTVADELDYIRAYLDIYKRRYLDKFDYQIDISDDIRNYRVQKMILQPVVENCIKHGFESMKSGGCIEIKGRQDDTGCIFEVVDNGKGMSATETTRLRRQINEESGQSMVDGIGLFNVHQRIVLERGPDYGIIAIDSREGECTRVVLRT